MPSYATRADLVGFVPGRIVVPDDPEATRLLRHASEVVARLTVTAVYDTDQDGLPTDADKLAAMRDATCAQAEWWLDTGDESGAQAQYQSVSIGSVSLTRAARGGWVVVGQALTVSERAVDILRLAGLLQQEPLIL